MKCAGKICTLSSNFLPSGVSTADYNFGIYNATNVLQSSTLTGNYVVFSSSTTITNYTKIANNGSILPGDAQLGTQPTDWACTKDNKTGLMWERGRC